MIQEATFVCDTKPSSSEAIKRLCKSEAEEKKKA